MQAVEEKQEVILSLPQTIMDRVSSQMHNDQTYADVLDRLLEYGDAAEKGDSGFLFLREIPLDGEVRKLRFPIPLVLNIAENGFVQLANTEYAILVSCETMHEALETAGYQFADNLLEYTDDAPMTADAREFGQKLLACVV